MTSSSKKFRSRPALLLVVVGVLILAAGAYWYFFGGGIRSIKREISRANYCETNADCKVITGQCPFGCYIPVNVAEGDRIEGLVDGYASTCTYACMQYKGVDCISGTCQVRQ